MESHKKRQVYPILINEADPGEGPGGSGTPSLIFYKSFETALTTPVIWRSESTTANHFL